MERGVGNGDGDDEGQPSAGVFESEEERDGRKGEDFTGEGEAESEAGDGMSLLAEGAPGGDEWEDGEDIGVGVDAGFVDDEWAPTIEGGGAGSEGAEDQGQDAEVGGEGEDFPGPEFAGSDPGGEGEPELEGGSVDGGEVRVVDFGEATLEEFWNGGIGEGFGWGGLERVAGGEEPPSIPEVTGPVIFHEGLGEGSDDAEADGPAERGEVVIGVTPEPGKPGPGCQLDRGDEEQRRDGRLE